MLTPQELSLTSFTYSMCYTSDYSILSVLELSILGYGQGVSGPGAKCGPLGLSAWPLELFPGHGPSPQVTPLIDLALQPKHFCLEKNMPLSSDNASLV